MTDAEWKTWCQETCANIVSDLPAKYHRKWDYDYARFVAEAGANATRELMQGECQEVENKVLAETAQRNVELLRAVADIKGAAYTANECLRMELDLFRNTLTEAREALSKCMPSWLPPNVRDKRRETLARIDEALK